ncbi:hypothetical protein O0L34_g13195 [Tuta absoluta]|nr:hypothetical protein O0L34_g13195 [Tuta absoluta]
MAEDIKVTSASHCFGCLTETNNINLKVYHLQGDSLQTILQTEQLVLCYICIKLAKNTERFIHNVATVQHLLKCITEMKYDIIRGMMKPLILTATLLDQDSVIQEYDEKVKIENKYDLEFPVVTEDGDTEIKQELSDDNFIDEMMDDNVDRFINGIENALYVKDEKGIPVLNMSKLKETKVKRKNNRKREDCKRNKMSSEEIKVLNECAEEDAKIETVYLTNEQCLEERAEKRLDSRYLNCQFKCEACIKGFNYRPSYDKHMEKHRKMIGEFKCDYCNQCYVSEENLNGHLKSHEVRYKCTMCSYIRNCRYSVSEHITTEHGAGLASFQCPKCEKTFKSNTRLRKHIFDYHSARRVECKYCNVQYANRDTLKAHLMRKHPTEVLCSIPAKKYICKECGMAFESPSHLKIHSTKHSHKRDFYCVECDKSFKTNHSLQQHLKTVSVHVTNQKYACLTCEKRFTTKAHVERHTRDVHIKAARYYCDQCGKEYRCKYKLAGHLQKHDGYERPRSFICTVCNKGFQTNRVLNVHMRIHTGEKPYNCSECPAQFNQYGSLYNHRKLVHKIVGKANKQERSLKKTQIKMSIKKQENPPGI